jgi:PEP-CTERM motif
MKHSLALAAVCLTVLSGVTRAQTATVPFEQLSGQTGVNGGTTVFRADLSLSGLAQLQSITLPDSNSGLGGSGGAFSGFDLDAVKLANVSVATAGEASALAGLSVFDFASTGTFFTPGTQRPPVAPKLSGTDATGLAVDPAFATLDKFDAVFFTSGGVSLGDGGSVGFNLTAPVSPAGMFLYVGEIGTGAGESLLGAQVSVAAIPEPETYLLMLVGLSVLALKARRRRRLAA